MWRTQRLHLGHVEDKEGRSIPGQYEGKLSHGWCNESAGGRVNPWNVRGRAEQARAARSPERQEALDHKAARKLRKAEREEFDRVQKMIAANKSVSRAYEPQLSQDREW